MHDLVTCWSTSLTTLNMQKNNVGSQNKANPVKYQSKISLYLIVASQSINHAKHYCVFSHDRLSGSTLRCGLTFVTLTNGRRKCENRSIESIFSLYQIFDDNFQSSDARSVFIVKKLASDESWRCYINFNTVSKQRLHTTVALYFLKWFISITFFGTFIKIK